MKAARRKWAWALGTTSVAGKGRHYVIADIDRKRLTPAARRLIQRARRSVVVRTTHGWHIYTDRVVTWPQWRRELRGVADSAWMRIAAKRGYAFLRDASRVTLDWPVQRMRIRWRA